MRIDTRITAKTALEDHQLWADVEAGKKRLVWRIGHEWHTIEHIGRTNRGGIGVSFKDDTSTPRHIKPQTKLTIEYLDHPDYWQVAARVRSLLSKTGEQIDLVSIPETQQYGYKLIVGYSEGQPLIIAADVHIVAFERHTTEELVNMITQALHLEAVKI